MESTPVLANARYPVCEPVGAACVLHVRPKHDSANMSGQANGRCQMGKPEKARQTGQSEIHVVAPVWRHRIERRGVSKNFA